MTQNLPPLDQQATQPAADLRTNSLARVRFTARLRLEPIGPAHAEDLWRLHADPAIAEWHGGPWSLADARANAEASQRAWSESGLQKWMAYDRETGELIGRGGLAYMMLDGVREVELGRTVRSSEWGRGYGTEIGRLSLAVAFNELCVEQVVAFTKSYNQRARSTLRRLGLTYSRDIITWPRDELGGREVVALTAPDEADAGQPRKDGDNRFGERAERYVLYTVSERTMREQGALD